jgi:biopolymer transport protein ExbD
VIIVSLIDIFAILLIFVIVTTTFKRAQPEVSIKLPESASAVATERLQSPVTLTITATGDFFIDAKPVASDELAAALREIIEGKQPLALNADTKAPFGAILKVIDSLKSAGAKELPAFTETAGQ